jgi:hypothetical protein
MQIFLTLPLKSLWSYLGTKKAVAQIKVIPILGYFYKGFSMYTNVMSLHYPFTS